MPDTPALPPLPKTGKYAKHERWRQKNIAAGLCPCCGKPTAPGFKQCARRISYKKLHRYMTEMMHEGYVYKTADGAWAITERGLAWFGVTDQDR